MSLLISVQVSWLGLTCRQKKRKKKETQGYPLVSSNCALNCFSNIWIPIFVNEYLHLYNVCSLLGIIFKLLLYTYWFQLIEWSKLLHTLQYHFFSLCRKSGWESISGESHLNALLRGEVFLALATFGHNKTHKEAIQRFQTLLNDRNTHLLSADTRKVMYFWITSLFVGAFQVWYSTVVYALQAAFIVVMLNASTTDRNGFESLLKLYREADTVQEKELVLRKI